MYYDSQKGGVDFIVKKLFGSAIPIESGIGKKTKRQVKNVINKYDAEYGIIVSNKTDFIEVEDDVIFIPPKIFSFFIKLLGRIIHRQLLKSCMSKLIGLI